MRSAEIVRKTAETKIELQLNIDGKGNSSIDTGVGFFNHMLTLMTKHGFMDLAVKCDGDSDVDDHHSVEDVGIVLGQAFLQALGDKAGIRRYASVFTPMDESLSQVSIDISGRPFLYFDVEIPTEKVGTFDTELVEEFFRAFVNQSGVTLHIQLLHGKNSHHIIESIFKGFGRVLDEATAIDERIKGVRSTKGML
ncbi:imidazoleglycerol-phosphate dehydratase HisB [Caldifermentibacillus hisashii]|uniref:Imidazoleglycerol-phosphate dehydratase n=1 Tax=Caldifermentibacillus hisashii TaxID=996558 RepID=A0ABU9JY30_9BACI|nr:MULTISPECIES: imidazoleglycerol-phosphate dehydratase HisB [Bacillaceae]MCB5933724.1 imidazoleglycerol-phosphate dehydratase HisB [Bacillus sp. DFI.2.34]NWN97071.1 imidazoleglycerol-phosphate dehydratase HisB [Bacillus sp. (in: firmicutes)]MCB7075555.1 imidazoleglycerol-phosphate dehydratase HisB [Caldibacillus thermoamylovorans]MCM3053128.1 imidazoleglycerol-phosphate dehydratase HisB [Caldibacillus thermoamylovorans]MCM3797228.1 imidazoleglycerol-phosphate dehydratase HisB [Caldibacillus 